MDGEKYKSVLELEGQGGGVIGAGWCRWCVHMTCCHCQLVNKNLPSAGNN